MVNSCVCFYFPSGTRLSQSQSKQNASVSLRYLILPEQTGQRSSLDATFLDDTIGYCGAFTNGYSPVSNVEERFAEGVESSLNKVRILSALSLIGIKFLRSKSIKGLMYTLTAVFCR